MASMNCQRPYQLATVVICSVRAEQQQAFIDHITHFLTADSRSPAEFSILFFPPPLQQPSARELEVLKLVAEGYSNREIAEYLILSPNTIKSHVRNLMNKFGVDRRVQLVAIAMAFNPVENSVTALYKAS